MTYDEYEKKIREIKNETTKRLKDTAWEYIKSNGLDGDVIATNHDKRGKLLVVRNGEIEFYPYKKDGELSLKSMWIGYRGIEKYIIPAKEGKGE